MNLNVLDQIRQTLASKRSNLSDWLSNTPASKQDLQLGDENDQAVLDHLDTLNEAVEMKPATVRSACAMFATITWRRG